jgi:uncharacterized protein YjiS (DUF1127 family)
MRLLPEPFQDYLSTRIAGEFLPALKGLSTMFLTHLVGVYRQWRRYNQSLRELNRLGDRELADIGITRGDIPRVAWDNSER